MRISRLTYWPILAASRGEEHFIPDCAGRVEIAHARVVRVEQNGVLLLSDGRALLLEGVRLPLADGAPPALAAQVLASLSQMAQEGPVTFTTNPAQGGPLWSPTRSRLGTAMVADRAAGAATGAGCDLSQPR